MFQQPWLENDTPYPKKSREFAPGVQWPRAQFHGRNYRNRWPRTKYTPIKFPKKHARAPPFYLLDFHQIESLGVNPSRLRSQYRNSSISSTMRIANEYTGNISANVTSHVSIAHSPYDRRELRQEMELETMSKPIQNDILKSTEGRRRACFSTTSYSRRKHHRH